MITVIRIAGPMLTWPSPSKYRFRQTEAGPTLSAIQGLLASAMGVVRDQARPAWIENMSVAIRLDRPGSVIRDYHTINPVKRTAYRQLSRHDQLKLRMVVKGNGADHRSPVITERYYRQDQAILLFFDDPSGNAFQAFTNPKFALYAGRKACVLSFPFLLGRTLGSLEHALISVPSVTPANQNYLEAVLFAPPTELTRYKETVSRPERPAGRVGENYLMQERYTVLVNPPRLNSWWEVLDTFKTGGTAHVAF